MIKTMITEDYISFEIAKLLKEKGFDEDTICVYIGRYLLIKGEGTISNATDMPIIPAPTLQMAMKWLREVHNIHITIDCDICDSFDFYSIIRIKSEESWKTYVEYEDEGSNTCEEAAEKAVKYCLEHLI
jgi:hypothetical protein